ncbi:hypothetical protein AOLI_G00201200 [Acnodon oligacanthus]
MDESGFDGWQETAAGRVSLVQQTVFQKLNVPKKRNRRTKGISKCRDDPPAQPILQAYPRTVMGDRRRSFKAAWCNIHPWLAY